ncbi:hypothetical protein ACRQ5Q_14930 [Bradyrhizobium sp. PMVTL-01]|uniref:hypothetical protein n=1 Tax=Bradyrhizobium sp. PMVTL-01 TaxID=3434999 RepID=UPI003F6FBAB2
MRNDLLHVVTCVANPIRWESRIRLAKDAIREWQEDGAKVTVVECAYGSRPYDLADLPGITHVPVRARTLVWNKECLLNIGIQRLPHDAQYIGTFDADIHFRKRHWAAETVHALQLYPVVQPWTECIDLGPNDEMMQAHKSFCSLHHAGKPVVESGKKHWKFDGGPYDHAHPGFAWAWTRPFLDEVGGLIETGGMGSGDHHMAHSLVGAGRKSVPAGTSESYLGHILRWEKRALRAAARKLGFVPNLIEHAFHGSKPKRGYNTRWGMFLEHGFDPHTDLKRNSYGVLEFAGNKPYLEAAFDRYLRSRSEDANVI